MMVPLLVLDENKSEPATESSSSKLGSEIAAYSEF
jgi:hypothetical protein